MALFMFFLVAANSSSFSAMRRSISCLTWVSSSWHLITLIFSCSRALGLGQGSLELHLLSLEPLPDFVNLVDGAASLADLVHDVLDLVAQGLVLPADLVQLQHGLIIGVLDAEKLS